MSEEVEGDPETTGRVYFGVFEIEDDPSVVTDLIGAAPTWVRSKGAPKRLGSEVRWRYSTWRLQSSLGGSAEVGRQLDELLPRLESLAAGIARARERWRCVLVIYQNTRHYNVQFELSADQIKRIAALGLPIWVDTYRFPDDG